MSGDFRQMCLHGQISRTACFAASNHTWNSCQLTGMSKLVIAAKSDVHTLEEKKLAFMNNYCFGGVGKIEGLGGSFPPAPPSR